MAINALAFIVLKYAYKKKLIKIAKWKAYFPFIIR